VIHLSVYHQDVVYDRNGAIFLKKHAYLIIANRNFGQLQLLINLLDDPRNDIFIEIDRTSTHNGLVYHTKYMYCQRFPSIGEIILKLKQSYYFLNRLQKSIMPTTIFCQGLTFLLFLKMRYMTFLINIPTDNL